MNYQVDDAGKITTTEVLPVENIIERIAGIDEQIAPLQKRRDELTDLLNRASQAPNISADTLATIQSATGVSIQKVSL